MLEIKSWHLTWGGSISNVLCLVNPQKWSWVLFTISQNSLYWGSLYQGLSVHPKLDLVNFAVRPLLFTKSCSSLNWICSKNEIGWNYSELKDINLKYILSKDSLRYININLPMFCNFQLLNIPIFQKNSKNHGKYPQNYPNIAKFQ